MFPKYTSLLSILLLFTLHLNGQEVIDPASLPEVEDYIVVRTNPDADTCILALHGGPTSSLSEGSFEYMEGIATFSVVEILKHEMLTSVLDDDSLTFQQGVAVNDTTAALIEKVVQYFLDQNKTVVLIGHSWGAIILGEFMDDYGVDHIHRIIPMEGRLSVQPEFVDYLLDDFLPTFDSDGYSILLNTLQYTYPHGLLTLGAAAFANRWTDSLANMDLSNMMYTYAENDMNTGALLPVETDFLESTGAQLLYIPNAAHGASYQSEHQATIVEFIRSEIFMEVNVPVVAQQPLKLYPTLAQHSIQIEAGKKGALHIYDMMGRPVLKIAESEFPLEVDVSNLVNGQYVVVVQDGTAHGTRTAKFQVLR